MNDFDTFIKNYLDNKGLNPETHLELSENMNDTLFLLQDKFIKEGHSKNDATKLAISYYSNDNLDITSIKNDLPLKNKVFIIPIQNKILLILSMLLLYFSTNLFFHLKHISLSNHPIYIFILTCIITLIPYIYFLRKSYSKQNSIKNFIQIYSIYFVSEKLATLFLSLVLQNIDNFLSSTSFNIISIFAFFVFCSLIIFIQQKFNLNINSKYTYWFNIKSSIIVLISVFLTIVYFALFNSNYYTRRILGPSFLISKNGIFFTLLNETWLVPNLGLILLILFSIIVLLKMLNLSKKKK